MATLIRKHNLVFIHIPKNGGTSISTWSRENLEGEKGTIKHSGMQHIKDDWPELKNPKTFAVVRNPWARLVSWYHFDGIKLKHKIDKGKFKGDYENQYNKYLKGFDYWLYNALDYKSNWFTYRQNQSEWLPKDPTWLLRLENIEKDFPQIQQFTNCFKPLTKENSTDHKQYQDYYTTTTKNYIGDLFSVDVNRFNYDF